MRANVADHDAKLALSLAGGLSADVSRYSTALAILTQADLSNAGDRVELLSATEAALPGLAVTVLDSASRVLAGSPLPPDHPIMGRAEAATSPMLDSEGRTLLWRVPGRDGGVVVARLSLDRADLQATLDVSDVAGEVRVLVTDGQSILYPQGAGDRWVEPGSIPGVAQSLSGEAGVTFAPSPDGEMVVAFAPVDSLGWALILEEPWLPLVAPLLQLDRVLFFTLLMAGATSLLALVFGLRFIVLPLRRLGAEAIQIGAGDFDAAGAPVGGVQEIEELRGTLAAVADRLRHYQERLESQLAAQVRAQEEERARLARELHDQTIQSLVVLSQQAQMAQRTLRQEPDTAEERLRWLRESIAEAIDGVRRLSQALRPLYLEDLGLVPALELLAKEAGAEFQTSGESRPLDPARELSLYRIAQEALNNAHRHADARHLRIGLSFRETEVALAVTDDGRGFSVPARLSQLAQAGHLGLLGMRERAQLAGGGLSIASNPESGTTVEVRLPY